MRTLKRLIPRRKVKTKGRRYPRKAFCLEAPIEIEEDLKRFLFAKLKEEKAET